MSRLLKRPRLNFTLIFSLFSARSLAQALPVEVTVDGSRDESAESLHSPRPNTVISSEVIKENAPRSLADAMRRSPSASVQQTSPGQGSIYVRGLSGRALGHVVDGVRLNAAIFRDGNNPYLGLVDVYSLDRIEVEPGAASVFYGSDALAGAVVMYTPIPAFRLNAPSTSVRAHQSFSSNPLSSVSHVGVAHSGPSIGFDGGVTWIQNGPIRPGNGQKSPDPESYAGLERDSGTAYRPELLSEQKATEFSSYAANGTLRLRLGSGTELITRAQASVHPHLVRYDQITPRFKNEFPDRAESELAPMYRTMLGLELINRSRHQFYDKSRIALSWQRLSERSLRRDYTETCLVDGAPIEDEAATCTTQRLDRSGRRVIENNRSDAFGLNIDFQAAAADRSRSLRAGITLLHDIVSSGTDSVTISNGEENAASERFPDGSSISEAGLFAIGELRPSDAWTVYAGARGSGFLLNVAERKIGTQAEGFRRTAFDYSASAGVSWNFVPTVAWIANAGRGLRMPNVQDFSTLGPRAQNRFQVPSASITPEHSYSLDSGFKLAHGRHRAQTTLFLLRYEDTLELAPTTLNGEETNADGERYYRTVNAGSLELWGVESYFDIAVLAEAAVFARFLAMIGNQYNSPNTGLPKQTPADRVPPHQGELGARFQPQEHWHIEVFASGRASQTRLNDPTNLDDNRIPEHGTPGYVTYHARGEYRFVKGAATRLAFDNLTNELVLEHGSGFYRPGFSATASLDLTLDQIQ